MEDASGSPNLTNAGTHFALGEGEDFYSIWDRAAMGQPVYRFPKTQDGWLVAWNTLAVTLHLLIPRTLGGTDPGPNPATLVSMRWRSRGKAAGSNTTPIEAARTSAGSAAHDEIDWRSYDEVAAEYAAVHDPRTTVVAKDLVEITPVHAEARVLDVGTGTGVGARAAAEAAGPGGLVVGVDPSLPMLRLAAASSHGAAAEAIDLPFRAATFDVVLSLFVLSHLHRLDTALFDMLRVLRSGGRAGVTAWGPSDDDFSQAWTEVAERHAEHEILADAYDQAMPWARKLQDPNVLKNVLHDAGLRDIRIERREYRFEMTTEDYLVGKETAATGRFLRSMLDDDPWQRFRQETSEVFAERFPPTFHDFRDVILASGHKP